MILSCSECGTRYVLDPAALGPMGRIVRCAICGHSWHQESPAEPEVIHSPAAQVTDRREDSQKQPDGGDGEQSSRNLPALRRTRGRRRLWIVLSGLLLVFAAIAAALYIERDWAAGQWPALQPLYEGLGLETQAQSKAPPAPPPSPPAAPAIDVTITGPRFETIDGIRHLTAELIIANGASQTLEVPRFAVQALDEQDRELKRWEVEVGLRRIDAQSERSVRIALDDPPSGVKIVRVAALNRTVAD